MAAYGIAERLRQAIDSLLIESGDRTVKISASFGVCEFFPESDESVTIEDLFERADIALYMAKEQGRNRTVLCQKEDL